MTAPLLLQTGRESEVYSLEVDGEAFTLKTRQGHNYFFEAYAYAQLSALGVAVPQALMVDDDALLLTAFAGKELDDQTALYERADIFTAAAQNLALCQQVQFKGFGHAMQQRNVFVGLEPDWQSHLRQVEPAFGSLIGIRAATLNRIRRFWSQMLPDIHLEQGLLVHGDFAMSAIFVNNDRFEGIIDFGDAIIGDPLMDLAYFRFKEITKPYGEQVYAQLRDPYLTATGLVHDATFDRTILFYMVYWGLHRLMYCPDENLKTKFAEKLRTVAQLLS